MREEVLVVRRDVLLGRWGMDGFLGLDEGYRFLRICRRHALLASREKVENDPSFKQIIPYCVLCYDGYVLAVVREKTQTEARLHGLASIGIGGHITPLDGDPAEFDRMVVAGLIRELFEEVHISSPWRAVLCGFLNDDSNLVGAVHFGFVYRVDCRRPPSIAETDKMRGALLPMESLTPPKETKWESWSQILVDKKEKWRTFEPSFLGQEPFLIMRP